MGRIVVAVGAATGGGGVTTGLATRTVPVGTANTLATGGPEADSTMVTAMMPTASGTHVNTTGSAQLREVARGGFERR